jgi:APA family basic amino acid/polyamine antiporter
VALVITVDSPPAAAAAVVVAAPTGMAAVGAVIIALQSAIYTYDGWTGPIYSGEELRDPARDIPRAMIGGVLLVSLLAAVNALQLMAARVPFAMSRDRLLPAFLHRVNPGGTPVPALVASTLVALACIATNTFDTVLAMLAFLFVANYALTFVALFASRRRSPRAARPFRVPGYPFVPGVALAGSLAFMVAAVVSDPANSVRSLVLGISWPVYFLIRRRTSARS